MSIKACNNLSTDFLVRTNDVPIVFRVELRGELGGIDQVTEQHRELTAFSVSGLRRGGWGQDLDGLDVCGGRRWPELGSRWGGARGHVRTTRPDQDAAVLIHREALAFDEFGF